jgi:hypothetical protein
LQEEPIVKRPVVAAIVAAAALLVGAGRADAHEVIVVCDEATGELVWSNTYPEDGPTTAVTDNGLTVSIPAEGTVSTPHPGPGTWTATWEIGDFVETGDLPPECVEATTTTPAPTTVPDTAPPTSEAGSNTIVPPPPSTSSSDTLPITGTGGAAAGVGVLLLAGGVVAIVAARRRPASS